MPLDIKTEIDHYTKDTLIFIVYGQSQYAKSVVVNELIGKQIILPKTAKINSNSHWRTIRFKYGLKQLLSLTLPDDNYELFDELSSNSKQWKVIPDEDLLLDMENEGDSAMSAAVLDVCVNVPLLKEGAMVVMTPTYDRSSLELGRQVFLSCTGQSKLIVPIFALEHDELHDDDIVELSLLKSLLKDELADHAGIFFTLIPSLEHYEHLQHMSTLLKTSLTTDDSSSSISSPPFPSLRQRSSPCFPTTTVLNVNDNNPPPNFLQMDQHEQQQQQQPLHSDSGMGSLEVANTFQSVNRCNNNSNGGGKSFNGINSSTTTATTKPASSYRERDPILLEDELSSMGLFVQPSFLPKSSHINPIGNSSSSNTSSNSSSPGSSSAALIINNHPPSSNPMLVVSGGIHRDIRENSFGGFNTPSSDLEARRRQHYSVYSVLNRNFPLDFQSRLIHFTIELMKKWLFRSSQVLLYVHQDVLQSFVLLAYELAYDIMVTPKKIEFARARENKLFEKLMKMTRDKQPEFQELIQQTLRGLKEEIPGILANFQTGGPYHENALTAREYKIRTDQLRQHVLELVDNALSDALCNSIADLKETYGGAIERCIEALEKNADKAIGSPILPLQSILQSAYQVRVARSSSANFIINILYKIKELFYTLQWQPGLCFDENWKLRVANDLLNNISEAKIYRHTCEQITNRLKFSHDEFVSSLRKLETRIEIRNSESGEIQDRIRRSYAPHLAHMALELTALRDCVLFGMPFTQRELGRGQYGVVYSIAKGGSWGPYPHCCVKSVVPPDEKHWQDLALEFFYTSNMGVHDRIVRLYGAVIEPHFSGGNPAVFLVMERMKQDLHSAIRNGLSWAARLQVAIDVMEGIRYLHGQGLIHRDIKLKNVLLDKDNRAKLTDLGFCKPHSMMSGSVVGTPIHMAPELLRGEYHSSVDIYAFGILFWYICANTTRLPYKFEHYSSKDELWSAVKTGLRPEKLSDFDENCWQLMTLCWHGDAAIRPYPGDVERTLRAIYSRTVQGEWDNSIEINRVEYQRIQRREKERGMREYRSIISTPQIMSEPIAMTCEIGLSMRDDQDSVIIDTDATPKFTPHPLVVPEQTQNTFNPDE